ncbi:hypothetical protein HDU93_002438, partial [Gonapodya sp. JEL0774]
GLDRSYGIRLGEVLRANPAMAEVDVVVEGMRGDNVVPSTENPGFKGRLAKRLDESKDFPFDWVVILGGTNDIEDASKTPERIANALKDLYIQALQSNPATKVLALSVLDYPEAHLWPELHVPAKRSQLNGHIESLGGLAKRTHVFDLAAHFPLQVLTADSGELAQSAFFDPDGTHLTADGYDKMGELVGAAILECEAVVGDGGV